jgi:CheY-like chemotaxis protein
MATLLVVDDSPVDRCLMGGILQRDDNLHVEFANNGVAGLESAERLRPDAVVTDLIMPEMDGLQLVSELTCRFPKIPVILVTSKGSEEVALRALSQGAASYVPKSHLNEMLLDTVHEVLAVSSRNRTRDKLLECMSRQECEFVLGNDSNLIFPLVSFLQDGACELGVCAETEKVRLGVALEEALTNALYHGNLEVGSELRATDPDGYRQLIEERRGKPPYRDRKIFVQATFGHDEARFVVRDEGRGFDPEGLPDPTDPENLEKCSGRGVLLMRTFMDEVSYNPRGNEVTLIKRARLSPCGDSEAR